MSRNHPPTATTKEKTYIFVVVPGDQLDKGFVQLDPSVGVKDGGARVTAKIIGDHLVLGVAEDSLQLVLGGTLDGGLDVLVRGGLGQAHGQIHHRHVGRGHAQRHTRQLPIQSGNHFAHRFRSTRRRGNNVLASATARTPILAGWTVHGLLRGRHGVAGGLSGLWWGGGSEHGIVDACKRERTRR